MRTTRTPAAIALGLALGLALGIAPTSALAQAESPAAAEISAVQLTRTSDGASVPPAAIEAALAGSSVLARLEHNQTLQFYSASVTGVGGARVLLSASADLLLAASLDGMIRAGDVSADAGELLMWQPGQPEAQSFAYDVRRFLASTTLDLDEDLADKLGALAERQARLVFWGVLERVGVNAQALQSPVVEPERREYLRRPVILRLRLRHDTVEGLAGGVAQDFAAALASADSETVADLLNPALFVPEGQGIASSGWQELRRAFAGNLAREPWRARLGTAQVEPGPAADMWLVRGPSETFAITVNSFDGMVFVNGLRPFVEAPGGEPGGDT